MCNVFIIFFLSELFTTACVDFLSQTLETEITYSKWEKRSQIEQFVIAL